MRVSLLRITDGLQNLQSRHRVLRFGLGVGLLGAGTLILIGLGISSIPSPVGSFAALLLALGTLVIGTAPSGARLTLSADIDPLNIPVKPKDPSGTKGRNGHVNQIQVNESKRTHTVQLARETIVICIAPSSAAGVLTGLENH